MDAKTFGQVELFKREIAELTEEKYALIKRIKAVSYYTSPSPRDVEESRMPSSA